MDHAVDDGLSTSDRTLLVRSSWSKRALSRPIHAPVTSVNRSLISSIGPSRQYYKLGLIVQNRRHPLQAEHCVQQYSTQVTTSKQTFQMQTTRWSNLEATAKVVAIP